MNHALIGVAGIVLAALCFAVGLHQAMHWLTGVGLLLFPAVFIWEGYASQHAPTARRAAHPAEPQPRSGSDRAAA